MVQLTGVRLRDALAGLSWGIRRLALLSWGLATGCGHDSRVDWDQLVVPGQRVGGIVAGASIGDVIAAAGTDSVKWDSTEILDGNNDIVAYDSMLVIFPGSATRELRVTFTSGDGARKVSRVLLRERAATWHTPEGLAVAVRLKTIEELNGRPFRVSTFGADLPPRVLDWNGGRLSDYYRSVIVQFGYQGTEELSVPDYLQIGTGNSVMSDQPVLQRLNPLVVGISVCLLPTPKSTSTTNLDPACGPYAPRNP